MPAYPKKTQKPLGQINEQTENPPIEGLGAVQVENREHREFLFKTFHDMRNPLHAIMGYTSLVLRKTRDQIPEKHQENLEKVLQSAEKLREIVDRMVAFYRDK
jgi:signal transduction histidine kinase